MDPIAMEWRGTTAPMSSAIQGRLMPAGTTIRQIHNSRQEGSRSQMVIAMFLTRLNPRAIQVMQIAIIRRPRIRFRVRRNQMAIGIQDLHRNREDGLQGSQMPIVALSLPCSR